MKLFKTNKFCKSSSFTHFFSSSLNFSKQLNKYLNNFILWYSQNGGVSLAVEFYNLLAKWKHKEKFIEKSILKKVLYRILGEIF